MYPSVHVSTDTLPAAFPVIGDSGGHTCASTWTRGRRAQRLRTAATCPRCAAAPPRHSNVMGAGSRSARTQHPTAPTPPAASTCAFTSRRPRRPVALFVSTKRPMRPPLHCAPFAVVPGPLRHSRTCGMTPPRWWSFSPPCSPSQPSC